MNEWQKTTLKQLAQINYGKAPPKLSFDGTVPVVGTGGNERFSHYFLFEGESIILGRKGTIDDLAKSLIIINS